MNNNTKEKDPADRSQPSPNHTRGIKGTSAKKARKKNMGSESDNAIAEALENSRPIDKDKNPAVISLLKIVGGSASCVLIAASPQMINVVEFGFKKLPGLYLEYRGVAYLICNSTDPQMKVHLDKIPKPNSRERKVAL